MKKTNSDTTESSPNLKVNWKAAGIALTKLVNGWIDKSVEDFMLEQEFKAWLRKQLPGETILMENTSSAGLGDIYWAHDGQGIWLETKILGGQRPKLRKAQYRTMVVLQSHKIKTVIVGYESKYDEVCMWYSGRIKREDIDFTGRWLKLDKEPDYRINRRNFIFGVLID